MYKLSIIIPIYNSENELKTTLDSIINQTMDIHDIEVIMINDGSTDNSGRIMESYSKRYSNFKSIHLDFNNGSPGKPRNIGIKNATADYIMFQDSDDVFTPEACEYLYNIIVDEDADIVGGMLTVKDQTGEDVLNIDSWVNIIDKSSDDFMIKKERVNKLLTDNEVYKFKVNTIYDNVQMLRDSWFTSKIFRKSFILKNNIKFAEGLNGGEDAVFLFNSLLNAEGIIFINKIISHYNTQNSNSLTHDKSFKTIESRINAYNMMLNIAQENHAEEIFVKNVLHLKLNYWFITNLFKASYLTINQIINIFKLAKPLFEKCQFYKVTTSKNLLNFSNFIIEDNFFEIIKEYNKRCEHPTILISIIIPVYNVGDLLFNAFDSILNQSIGFENLEIIFVDDCSTDNSLNIIKSFSEEYQNVKFYSTGKNSGFAGKPRNKGIEHANGEYVMFLDPDDIFLEDACTILFENIIGDNLDVVSANFYINRNSEKTINNWNILGLKNNQFKQVNSIDEFYKFLMPPASVWAKIFNKNFILNEKIKFLEGVPAQDLVFVSEALIKANGIKFINKPIVEYIPRENGDNKSTTSKRNKNVLLGYIKSYTELYYLFLGYRQEYSWLATRNLFFWLKQFMLSELPLRDKIDLLYYAKPLLEDFICSDRLNPPKGMEQFFEYIIEGNYYEAANLSYSLSVLYDDHVNNIIKTKPLIILCSDFNLKLDSSMKSFLRYINYIYESKQEIFLINLDSKINFDYIINNFKKKGYLPNNIKFINIYDYYSKKYTQKNVVFTCPKENNETDKLVKNYVKEDNSSFIEFYDKDKLLKKECYFDDILQYQIEYDEKSITKRFYTSCGFEYLIMKFYDDGDIKIMLNDKYSNFTIFFDSITEFNTYFIEEILMNFEEKPFLINGNFETGLYFEKINSSIAYKIFNFSEYQNYNNSKVIKIFNNVDYILVHDELDKTKIMDNFNIEIIDFISKDFSLNNLLYEIYINKEKEDINRLSEIYPSLDQKDYDNEQFIELNEKNFNLFLSDDVNNENSELSSNDDNINNIYSKLILEQDYLKKEIFHLNIINSNLNDKINFLTNYNNYLKDKYSALDSNKINNSKIKNLYKFKKI